MTGLTDLDSRIAAAMEEVAALRHESRDLDARLREKPAAVNVETLLYPRSQCISELPCPSSSSTSKTCVHTKASSLTHATSSPCEAHRTSSPCEEPFAEPAVVASSPAFERTPSPQIVADTILQAPLMPKVTARPTRRSKPQQQPQEFPSEEELARLSRKERIALLEREEQENIILVPAPAPARLPQKEPEFPSDEQMANMSRKERIALLEKEQGVAMLAPAPAPVQLPQQVQELTDEQMASMSRKERIAFLEREEQGDVSSSIVQGDNSRYLARDTHDRSSKQQRPEFSRRCEERQSRSPLAVLAMSTSPSSEHAIAATATPRRPREERRPQAEQCFPSDDEFSKMSRKERIALMERDAHGSHDDASDLSDQNRPRGRLAQSQPPRGRTDCENSVGGVREASTSPVSGLAARRCARSSANSDPDRYDGPVETNRAVLPPRPAKEYLSDEAFASLSRKERIALLEREAGSSKKGEMRTSSPSCKLPPIEQSSPRSNPYARGPPRIPSVGPRHGSVDGNSDHQPPGADEEAAFEQRRQQRRIRLQQRQRVDAPIKASRSDDLSDPVEDLKQALRDKNQTFGARETQLQKVDRRHAGTGSSTQPTICKQGKQLLEEMEALASGASSSCQWPALCKDLAATAHRLQPGDVLRAIQCLSACADGLDDEAAAAMREAAEALLACVSPQLGSMDCSLIADFLHVMAAANVGEQTYLDMMLAQLLVVLRKNDAVVTPRALSVLARSIALLHSKGLSAKKAGSGASSTANKRCVDILNQRLANALMNFGEDEFACVGGVYLVAFFEDNQRRTYLARAAELEVGLGPTSRNCLVAMKAVEVAVRQHSFAFIATLPDASKDYLAKLKAAAV